MQYRQPLGEVMEWPASHVQLIAEFLRKQPLPEARVERLLARVAHDLHNANFKPPLEMKDFVFADPWPKPDPSNSGRYSDADRQTMSALMNLRAKR